MTSLASLIQIHRKNPTLAIPSTIIIIPAIKIIVDQLTPTEASSAAPAAYQNSVVNMHFKFSAFQIASGERITNPNTKISVNAPQSRVTICLSILSNTISTNITTKITVARICAVNIPLLLSNFYI